MWCITWSLVARMCGLSVSDLLILNLNHSTLWWWKIVLCCLYWYRLKTDLEYIKKPTYRNSWPLLSLIYTTNFCTSSRRVVGSSWNNGGRSCVSMSSGFCIYQFSIPGSPCCIRWVTIAVHWSCSPHLNTDSKDWSTADPHSLLIVSGRKENLLLYLLSISIPVIFHLTGTPFIVITTLDIFFS